MASAAPRSETPMLLVWALAVIAGAIFVVARAEHRTLRDPIQQYTHGVIGDASPRAMYRPANLTRSLAQVKADMRPGEKVESVETDTGQVDVTLIDAADNRRELRIDLAGHLRTSSSFKTEQQGVPISAIDPAAPLRLVRGARKHTRAGTIDRIFFSSAAGGEWSLTLKSDRQLRARDEDWVGDARGRHVRRRDDFHAQSARAEQIAQCVAKAKTSAAKLRCTR